MPDPHAAPDPIALAAEARRLAAGGASTFLHGADEPCACEGPGGDALVLLPALADAVEALVRERDRLRDSFRESLALVVQWHERAEDAEADRDRLAAELVEARAETARIIAECRAEAQRDRKRGETGCGDHSCLVVPATGMGTNGGCMCGARALRVALRMARAVAAKREACATVVDSVPDGDDVSLDGLAAAIRARGGA